MFGMYVAGVILVSLVGLMFHWISWDLQHKDERPAFSVQIYRDVSRILGRGRASVPGMALRLPVAITPAGPHHKERNF